MIDLRGGGGGLFSVHRHELNEMLNSDYTGDFTYLKLLVFCTATEFADLNSRLIGRPRLELSVVLVK